MPDASSLKSRCKWRVQTSASCKINPCGPCQALHAQLSMPSARASGSVSRQERRCCKEHRNSRGQGGRARCVDVRVAPTDGLVVGWGRGSGIASIVLRVVATSGIAAAIARGIASVVLRVVVATSGITAGVPRVVVTGGIASVVLRVVVVTGGIALVVLRVVLPGNIAAILSSLIQGLIV